LSLESVCLIIIINCHADVGNCFLGFVNSDHLGHPTEPPKYLSHKGRRTWLLAAFPFVCWYASAASCWNPSPGRVDMLSVVPFRHISETTCHA
jgi:hypothetical protein